MEKEIMEGKCCQAEALGILADSLDDKMFGDDFMLKDKIKKERILFNEKKTFRAKKEVIEKNFKTNIENMLE
jgi:hypothetical protein